MSIPTIQLWESGVYLSKAPYAYAHEELKEQYDQAFKASAFQTYFESLRLASEQGKTGVDALSDAANDATPLRNEQTKARDAVEAFAKHHLLKGNLIAYGFEPPRRVESQPHQISAECWSGSIRWQKSTLSAQGLVFEEIRVVSRSVQERVLTKDQMEYEPTKPQGRPTVGPAIEAAFLALNKAGEIDATASQSSHYPRVRSWLAANFPDLKTPPSKISEKTLYRYFSPLFRRL